MSLLHISENLKGYSVFKKYFIKVNFNILFLHLRHFWGKEKKESNKYSILRFSFVESSLQSLNIFFEKGAFF